MPVPKANQRAVNKYKKNNYDRIEITVPKGQRDVFQAHAAARGESTNAFIGRAIQEAMERDNATQYGDLVESQGDCTVIQPLKMGILDLASEAARAVGIPSADYISAAIENQVKRDSAGGPQEDAWPGVVSIPLEALETAQRAAEAAGEGLPQFVTRAIESRAALDKRKRG